MRKIRTKQLRRQSGESRMTLRCDHCRLWENGVCHALPEPTEPDPDWWCSLWEEDPDLVDEKPDYEIVSDKDEFGTPHGN